MANYKNKAFTLRMNNEIQEKIKFIAEKEDRTITAQYERIARKYIQEYEAEHGEIVLQNTPPRISKED